ncbi:NAD(P)-dependent oxidoreductase [Fodinibius salsisoli]|uniref:SDR family oxidoreductase n=1 Tax=Fodinibius salsisoli TaxID=2820877 RepID=A0ABT3PP77_9BACT|nr:SDR family oxidoreductase [Fodinibius salsisoli]MCW9707658.1 SDR family oxidoreductase [Fodinibius salsisoli]
MKFILLYLFYALILSFALKQGALYSRVKSDRKDGNNEKPERILVIGATGGTGQELVRQLLGREYQVTAFVRNPAGLKIEHPKLTIAQGNVLDYESVEKAVRGNDAVLSALGHKRFFYPTRILSKGTHNLLRAMEKFGVSRLVCETSLGIGNSAGRLGLYYTFFTIPVILPFYFWDKARQEKLITESNVNWTIVRPGVLTNNPKHGNFRHGPDIGSYIWTVRISRGDVAEFMICQLTDDTYLKMAVAVAK